MTAAANARRSATRTSARAAKPREFLVGSSFTITRDDSRGDAGRWVVGAVNGTIGAYATRGAARRAIDAFMVGG